MSKDGVDLPSLYLKSLRDLLYDWANQYQEDANSSLAA